jgi:transposase-like protein
MAAPRKYSLELCERAVRMYRTTDPKPQIKKLAVDLGVHPEALRGWIRQAEACAAVPRPRSPRTWSTGTSRRPRRTGCGSPTSR